MLIGRGLQNGCSWLVACCWHQPCLVELDEVLLGDDVVGVEVQHVVEEVPELVPLEVGEQLAAADLA